MKDLTEEKDDAMLKKFEEYANPKKGDEDKNEKEENADENEEGTVEPQEQNQE